MPPVIGAAIALSVAGGIAAAAGVTAAAFLGTTLVAGLTYGSIIASVGAMAGAMIDGRRQAKKARQQADASYNASLRDTVLTVRGSVTPRVIVLGKARVGGTLVYLATAGADKDTLYMVLALAGEEVDDIGTVYFNDDAVTLNSGGYVVSAPYFVGRSIDSSQQKVETRYAWGNYTVRFTVPAGQSPNAGSIVAQAFRLDDQEYGYYNTRLNSSFVVGAGYIDVTYFVPDYSDENGTLYYTQYQINLAFQYTQNPETSGSESKARVWKYLGKPGQAADPTLMAKFPGVWTAQHTLNNTAYLVVELKYSQDAFPSGLPSISADVRGSKVYDPRDGVTRWTENPALLCRHWVISRYGANKPARYVVDSAIIAAANACDELVTYNLVGAAPQQKKRYRASIAIRSGVRPYDVLSALTEAMGGEFYFTGDRFVAIAGEYRMPVMALTDDDFTTVSGVQVQPSLPREQLVNTANGTFFDENNSYKEVQFGTIVDAPSLASDGTELVRDFNMDGVPYGPQAQQLVVQMMRDMRQALTVASTFKLRAYPLELFDTVTVTNTRYGWANKVFQIRSRVWSVEGGVQLGLKETSPAIWEMGTGFSVTDRAPNTNLPRPWDVAVITGLAAASGDEWLIRTADGSLISRIRVSWNEIADAAVRSAGTIEVEYRLITSPAGSGRTVIVPGGATEAFITPVIDGATYLIKARGVSLLARGDWSTQIAHTVVGKLAPPSDVAVDGLTAEIELYGIRLGIKQVPDTDVSAYEIRLGDSGWGTATFVARVAAVPSRSGSLPELKYLYTLVSLGVRTFWVKALDSVGNYSVNARSVQVTIVGGRVDTLGSQYNGPNIELLWSATDGTFPISKYRVTYGPVLVGSLFLNDAYVTFFARKVAYGGSRTYWIEPIDAAGNVGAARSITVAVFDPIAPTIISQVIDNNVLLRWSDAAQSLPIERYEMRRGEVFDNSPIIADNGNSRFATFFETAAGDFRYWIRGIDSAGNFGLPASIKVSVSQPPDFELQADDTFFPPEAGWLLENAAVSGQWIVAPVNLTESWEEHFQGNAWSSPQDQIDAGYPIYAQPNNSSMAVVAREIDYVAAVATSTITATVALQSLANLTPAVVGRIGYKLALNDPWTWGLDGQNVLFATNFRYVRVEYTIGGYDSTGLVGILSVNVKLAVKVIRDNGVGTAVATDAAGTRVNLNRSFLDLTGPPIVQPRGTTAKTAVVDFVDAPNPTHFFVFLFDANGVRVSGEFAWSAIGV